MTIEDDTTTYYNLENVTQINISKEINDKKNQYIVESH